MPQQLDIFADSRDVVLRNDLAQALLDGDCDRAQAIADTLAAEFGSDPALAPGRELLAHLRWRQASAGAPRLDLDALQAARAHLAGALTTAATAALGAGDAPRWLTAQWLGLAGQAAHVAWDPAQAEVHPAALYLRAQAWQAAAQAVARITSWRRIPQPLLWMAQARWRGEGIDAGWPLLAEALWLAPARAAALLQALADRELGRLIARFEERFEERFEDPVEEAWAWFPAFALVDTPLLAGPLALAEPPAQSPPAQAFQTIQALLRLERQGRHHDIVAHRARLQSLSPPLFAAYMSTRCPRTHDRPKP